MDFAYKLNDGHFGARKFWRNYLPRLKYHNPAVSMTINRTTDQAGLSTMTIFFAPPPDPISTTRSPIPTSSTSTSTTISGQAPFDRTESIDMKYKNESDILARLMSLTTATPVVATPEEEAELQGLEEQRKRGLQDAERMAEVNERRRREKSLLQAARGVVGETQALV